MSEHMSRQDAEVVRLRREIESLRADCYQTLNDPRAWCGGSPFWK